MRFRSLSVKLRPLINCGMSSVHKPIVLLLNIAFVAWTLLLCAYSSYAYVYGLVALTYFAFLVYCKTLDTSTLSEPEIYLLAVCTCASNLMYTFLDPYLLEDFFPPPRYALQHLFYDIYSAFPFILAIVNLSIVVIFLKIRFRRFSVRTLLILVTCAGLILGSFCLGNQWIEHYEQSRHGLLAKKLVEQLNELDENQPKKDAQERFSNGDFRYLAIDQRLTYLPGIDQVADPGREQYQILQGTSDMVESRSHWRLILRAKAYAREFNIEMMKLRNNPRN